MAASRACESEWPASREAPAVGDGAVILVPTTSHAIRGERVRLSEVVKLVERSSLQSITRVNRERAISLYGSPAPGVDQQTAVDESLRIARETLEPFYAAAAQLTLDHAEGARADLEALEDDLQAA